MKATLEFDLPDEAGELLEALSVQEYTSVLLAFRQQLRTLTKHGHSFASADEAVQTLKERMEARRPRWLERMRNDPNRQASRRCDSAWSRAPSGIDLLSAPVFRLGSRGVLHHQPFQIGGDAAVLCFCLLEQERLEFDGYPDGNGFWLVQRWNSPVVLC